MSCSATAMSSSSNLCSGLASALPARAGLPALGATTFGAGATVVSTTAGATTSLGAAALGAAALDVFTFCTTFVATFVATFALCAISATPFHFVDGARELPCLGFKTPHPFRVVTPFGLGKLADYPTVQALHVVEVDAHRQLFGHIVVNTRRRSRPCPSNQVLFLCGITRQLGLEPRRAAALVSLQHPNVYTAILFVQLIRGDLCSHPLEGDRPDRKQLQQISAYGEFLPRQAGRQTGISVSSSCAARLPSPPPPGGGSWLCGEEMGLDSDPAGCPLSIAFPDRRIGDLFQHLAGPARGKLQVVGISGIEARQRVLDPELPARQRIVDELLPALRRLVAGGPQELVRVLGRRRDGGDAGAHLMRGGKLDGLEGGRAAGPVGVEDQQHLVGEAREQAHLVVGERGARAGDCVLHAELVRGDDVELALHEHRVAVLGDLVAGEVQAEDHSSFYVGGGFRRVDVLPLLVGTHRPSGEREGLAALVPDGDDQALREEVGAVAPHQPGLLGVLQGFLLRPQVLAESAARRCVAELEP